jgi:hypothetical protein
LVRFSFLPAAVLANGLFPSLKTPGSWIVFRAPLWAFVCGTVQPETATCPLFSRCVAADYRCALERVRIAGYTFITVTEVGEQSASLVTQSLATHAPRGALQHPTFL